MDDVAIKVDHVSKDFVLPHEKITSIKSAFTHAYRLGQYRRTRETQHALKDISLEIKKGEFFGIVGRNGSGKSTLLKILAGIYQPTKGKVVVHGKLVPFIELGVGFNPELTGRENVFLNGAMMGFSRKEVAAMYDDIVAFAELERFMDQKLKNYSSGMQVRLAFSMATRAKADILLVDEVLAVGDADFQRKCFEYFKELKSHKKTVVFVTHDMDAVREYCDRAALIDRSIVQSMGSARDIAKDYMQLFSESTGYVSEEDNNVERWGNGGIRIESVLTNVNPEYVTVTVDANAYNDVDRVIYGLHIVGQDGVEVAAMNNRMILEPDVKQVRSGDRIKFKWRMLNIFNDGRFYVTLTLIDDMSNTLDWFTRASSFTVRRDMRSTTSVLPPLDVTVNLKANRSKW